LATCQIATPPPADPIDVSKIEPEPTAGFGFIDSGASRWLVTLLNLELHGHYGGVCSCATGHVRVKCEWLERVGKPTEIEQSLNLGAAVRWTVGRWQRLRATGRARLRAMDCSRCASYGPEATVLEAILANRERSGLMGRNM
jgi:hypothetical protein